MLFRAHFSATLLLLLRNFFQCSAASLNCDVLLRETDKCVLDIFVVGQGAAKIPRTDGELDVYCDKFQRHTVPCIKRYASSCLTPFPRQLFTVGYGLGVKQLKKFCNTENGRKEWLNHTPCFKNEQLQLVQRYMDTVTVFVEHVEAKVDSHQMIPWICCAYFTIYEQAKEQLYNLCPQPKTVDFFLNIVKSVATDLVDIGCGQYSTPTSCRKHLPEAMAVFDKLSDPTKLRSPGYSPVIPLVSIMKKLDA
ncbi:hypothetical protein HDE_01243 [Halotydeus destructor]|nr:hypothetical protein HDE_01243 [Halotydeus destructor]